MSTPSTSVDCIAMHPLAASQITYGTWACNTHVEGLNDMPVEMPPTTIASPIAPDVLPSILLQSVRWTCRRGIMLVKPSLGLVDTRNGLRINAGDLGERRGKAICTVYYLSDKRRGIERHRMRQHVARIQRVILEEYKCSVEVALVNHYAVHTASPRVEGEIIPRIDI